SFPLSNVRPQLGQYQVLRRCTVQLIGVAPSIRQPPSFRLPLDQEPPRLRTRFTARRPSTVRGVSPAALMPFAPRDTVAFGDLHSPTCSRNHNGPIDGVHGVTVRVVTFPSRVHRCHNLDDPL